MDVPLNDRRIHWHARSIFDLVVAGEDAMLHYDRAQMHELPARFTLSRHDLAPAHQIEISGGGTTSSGIWG